MIFGKISTRSAASTTGVKMLDDHVGLIMAELKAQGIDDNTIVIFISDNGHELYYGPKPEFAKQLLADGEKANLIDRKWRTSECGDVFDGAGGRAGLKRSGYQGGMQCPLIARWPKKIAYSPPFRSTGDIRFQPLTFEGEKSFRNPSKTPPKLINCGWTPLLRVRNGGTLFGGFILLK